jgi:hypothetical protein
MAVSSRGPSYLSKMDSGLRRNDGIRKTHQNLNLYPNCTITADIDGTKS